MDIFERINRIVTLNDYIDVTRYLETEQKNDKIVINMSNIQSLKKMRCWEIEFFNKCDGIGAAFHIVERMLRLPFKTWSLLGPELISHIQYWLDTVRKHLISHHIHWWTFLKHLLEFIKHIRLKDHSLNNVLVQQIAESLLDLATSGKPDVDQRYEILYTLNMFCAESSRNVRQALAPKFEPYFISLATILATCGYVPGQLAALETLLRWMQMRYDRAARQAAADKWFFPHLYSAATVNVFVSRNWMNFPQHAREFLNCHNESKDLVTSVICTKLTVGETVVLSESETRDTWLDINSRCGSLTVTLNSRMLAALGIHDAASYETLAVANYIVNTAKLESQSTEVILSLSTVEPPSLLPSRMSVFQDGGCDVIIGISTHCNLAEVDEALRTVFENKYQLLLDVRNQPKLSPSKSGGGQICDSVNERSGQPRPFTELRRLRSGIAVGYRRLRPASASSNSSVYRLYETLANTSTPPFPKKLNEEILPELSVVGEESDISDSLESKKTLKLKNCSVLKENYRTYIRNIKSQSDGEFRNQEIYDDNGNSLVNIDGNVPHSQSDSEYVKKSNARPISLLFFNSLESADQNQLNETIKRMPKDKDLNTDNLMEMLVKEALQSKAVYENNSINVDSGIITGDAKKTQESDFVEGTQYTGVKTRPKKNKIVSKSTSDESNTEIVHEAPNYVSVRKRNQGSKSVKKTNTEKPKKASFDVQAVETFFSQHFTENQMVDNIISPTLAKKINETSSESSRDYLMEDLDNDFNIHMHDKDIVDCLNSIVDKVCMEFDKCTEYLDREYPEAEIIHMAKNFNPKSKMLVASKNIDNTVKEVNVNPKPSKSAIKLKFGKKQKAPKAKAKGKLKIEPISKLSMIIEDNNESNAHKNSHSDSKKESTDTDVDKPRLRKRRKLYSPKDDQKNFEKSNKAENSVVTLEKNVDCQSYDDKDVDDFVNSKKITKKSAATCYKQIEKDRQKFKRTQKQKTKEDELPHSPKTRKLNELFEKLKDNIESNENVIYVDKKSDRDATIFNFTSDSEDEEFKQKKIDIQMRTSTTTLGSGVSVISTRRGRAVKKHNYRENCRSCSNESNIKPVGHKRVTKRKSIKAKERNIKVDAPILVDERMRGAANEDLNTSFLAVNVDNDVKDPEPIIHAPRLENISYQNDNIAAKTKKRKITAKKHDKKYTVKPLDIIKDGNRSESPLPGLVIETEKGKNDREDSLTTNLAQKLQKMYEEGPDNDTNTTHNMIFDNDMINSPQMNITEELARVMDNENVVISRSCVRKSDNYETDVNTIDNTFHSEHETKASKAGSTKSSKTKRSKLSLNTKDILKNKVTQNLKTETGLNRKQKPDISEAKKSSQEFNTRLIKSSIGEITWVDTETVTLSKVKKSQSKSKEIEVIDVTAISEVQSEKSIVTDGITAHGDMDESPPGPQLLTEKMTPRELHDMDESIKKYYIDLNSKVNVSKDSFESNQSDRVIEKDGNKETKSNSAASSVAETHKQLFDENDYDLAKWLPSLADSESSQTRRWSPVVSIKKLSSEDMERWLPSVKTTSDSSFEKTDEIDQIKLRSRAINKKNRVSVQITPESTFEKSKEKEQVKPKSSPININNRKSQISPVNFDDFKRKSINQDTSTSKNETLISDKTQPKVLIRFPNPGCQSSPLSKSSKSEDSPPRTLKRKSPVTKAGEVKEKKLKLDSAIEIIDISGSTKSSNVDDWLKNNSTSCKVVSVDATSEVLNNIMEKIDTTLAEIHQNTTKDFITLFVEAQRQMSEMKVERRRSYTATAVAILKSITTHMDQTFAEMDQRAEERDTRLMSWLKQRACEIIKKDCKQKLSMVTLLREDAQTVADHLTRTRNQSQ